MEKINDFVELLFFDTFAHDNTEEINLDLVQFPKPVYVTEVRIIPLGARVQADFPGGVRLGATNPSQFKIEFFVNDLGKPGASAFESLGGFEYNQNGCINLECAPTESTLRKIPTDGLVLRGWYTTITLAVYGTLTKNITEQIIQPVVNPPAVPSQPNLVEPQQILPGSHIETEWPTENLAIPVEYEQPAQAYPQQYNQTEPYQHQPEYSDYYADTPKDPRNYHVENTEWNKVCSRPNEGPNERERERSRDAIFDKPVNVDRDHRTDSDKRDRDREKSYSSGQNRERERQPREYRGSPRDGDHDRSADRDRPRDRSYKHEESCRRSYSRAEEKEREERKRPRTPPMMSPKRPKTPHEITEVPSEIERSPTQEDFFDKKNFKVTSEEVEQQTTPTEEPAKIDIEEFEPILSDEDILDDPEHYQDLADDFTDIGDNDDLIRLFVPGSTDLVQYSRIKPFKISGNSIDINENLKIAIGICDDYFKSSITKYTVEEFSKLNTEIKEEFIHLCEKLILTIGSVEIFSLIIEIYQKTRNANSEKWRTVDKELSNQVLYIFDTTVDWLKIALDYELANSQDQPIYKIRHIKCGLRIAQFCFESEIFVNHLLLTGYNIYGILLDLYQQEYMAPSLKLMILKALDTTLIHKCAIEKFLEIKSDSYSGQNGYSGSEFKSNYNTLLNHLQCNSSVRLKFALCSILKKINLYEIFTKFHLVIMKLKFSETNVSTNEINLISKFLEQILKYLRNGQFSLTQPKRFLPVASQFEIVRDCDRNVLIEYFKIFNFIESVVLLLTHLLLSNLPIIKIPVLEVVSDLLETCDGIDYLSKNTDTVNVLLKYLLQTDEEVQYSIQNGIDIKSHSLGITLAYKLRCYQHISSLLDIGPSLNYDLTSMDIINELHGLFCLALSPNGKIPTAHVLGMTENFKAIAQLINLKEKPENQVSKMKKTPAILYLIDLIYIVVTHSSNIQVLEKYRKEILHVVNFEGQPDVCSFKLNSIKSYMTPIDNPISFDNISPFVDVIVKEIDNITERPEEVITALRIIYDLGISKYSFKNSAFESPFNNYVELKYKHVILQLFSLDGISLISKILLKLCGHYKQPGVHSSSFMSQQGLLAVELVNPCVILLKQMLTYAIQCRNTSFKDLTAVPILLQTYNLMLSYPMDSPYYVKCYKVRENIVDALLVYTQPISDEIHEKDTLNKTLWSMMCKEVIQYITQAPYTFIPGLLVLSELLPLPLPIQTNEELQEKDTSWMINLRKLWAAHLHPLSSLIQDFVNKLCTTSNQSLLNLLRRICVQISDLAANSALMIARGILDAVCEEVIPSEDSKVTCSPHLARLLNFLACLVTHSTLKCAVLSLLQTNSGLPSDQKYLQLISYFIQILRTVSQTNHHIQCQECILSIIQSFCDVEISLLQNPSDLTSNIYLSNALPIREHLIGFVEVICEHLFTSNSFVTCLPAVRTVLLLTEHDYGFYHMKEIFSRKFGLFATILEQLAKKFSKDNAECVSVLNTLMEFFLVSVVIEEDVGPLSYSPRSIRFNLNELESIIGWKIEDKHPLKVLKESLQGIAAEDTTFEGLYEKLTALNTLLNSDSQSDPEEGSSEPILPNPEPLLAQYSRRVVYNCTDTFNERLTAEYWLSVPNEETDSEMDNVAVDLADMCKQNLTEEYNLVREIEVLCRISSASIIEKEKKADDQKMKKPFAGPLRTRGFPRMVQQRSDLFRSRPPNTSRPPSLHVDDFVALETCGAQPTGPTGYNKISRELMASRNTRGTRGRAFVTSERAVQYRQMSWWGSGFGRLPY